MIKWFILNLLCWPLLSPQIVGLTVVDPPIWNISVQVPAVGWAVTACERTVTLNNTYWQTPSTGVSRSSACSLTVRLEGKLKLQKKPICQVRWVKSHILCGNFVVNVSFFFQFGLCVIHNCTANRRNLHGHIWRLRINNRDTNYLWRQQRTAQ